MFLSDIKEGRCAVISALNFNSEFKIRLRDMGFCEGEKVLCIKKALLHSPILYRVKDSNIALRRVDAKRIEVSTDE